MQTQGDATLHRVAGNQIEVGEVGDQLQHRAHINVLEVQRELFADVRLTVSVAFLQVIDGHRADADGQFVVSLEGGVLVGATGFNRNNCPISGYSGIDELHRGGEILDVEAYPQLVRQLRAREAEDDLAVMFLDIRGDGRIGQVDNHIAFPRRTTLEVHTANRPAFRHKCLGGRSSFSRSAGRNGCRARRSCRCALTDHHEQVIALNPRGVRRQLRQADNQPRALLGLNHSGSARIATAQIEVLAGQLTGDTGQVQGNPRRRFGGVALGLWRRAVERQLQLDAITRQRRHVERLQIGREYHR
ncbi:hypothetical protein D3C87_1014500 [compost metagenome]